MTVRGVHQMLVGAAPGDAITDQALLIQRWLRERGLRSELYAEVILPALRGRAHYADLYRPAAGEDWLIFHHSIGSGVVDQALRHGQRWVVIYHNVTRAAFF